MKRIIIISLLSSVLLFGCTDRAVWNNSKKLRTLFEMGVFAGQQAALEGKWVVKRDDGGVYYWSGNPYKLDEGYKKYIDKGFDLSVTYSPPPPGENGKE